eukprot:scaffold27565_cov48-Phaeocystis_antarctica.AAC.3
MNPSGSEGGCGGDCPLRVRPPTPTEPTGEGGPTPTDPTGEGGDERSTASAGDDEGEGEGAGGRTPIVEGCPSRFADGEDSGGLGLGLDFGAGGRRATGEAVSDEGEGLGVTGGRCPTGEATGEGLRCRVRVKIRVRLIAVTQRPHPNHTCPHTHRRGARREGARRGRGALQPFPGPLQDGRAVLRGDRVGRGVVGGGVR